jgi:hypothetical protein
MKWPGLFPLLARLFRWIFLGPKPEKPTTCSHSRGLSLGMCLSGPAVTCGTGLCMEHHNQFCTPIGHPRGEPPRCWMPPGIPPAGAEEAIIAAANGRK